MTPPSWTQTPEFRQVDDARRLMRAVGWDLNLERRGGGSFYVYVHEPLRLTGRFGRRVGMGVSFDPLRAAREALAEVALSGDRWRVAAIHYSPLPRAVAQAFRRFGLDLPDDRVEAGSVAAVDPGDVYGVYTGAA